MTGAPGYRVFPVTPEVLSWARKAHEVAKALSADPEIRATNLRHGETWFVGVDALPTDATGTIGGVPLQGPWQDHVPVLPLHRAQLSIVYPGYPGQDAGESDANHRYRIRRAAAHVDGLLPEGPQKRRFLREPHAYVLGLPLNVSEAAPLTVWPGSHRIMGQAFRAALAGQDAAQVDLTETYHAARRACFDQITPVALTAPPGGAILLHRHLLHGVAPWAEGDAAPPEGRMIAYFRPMFSVSAWLVED